MSDWELAEREARIEHMARLTMRGASRSALADAFPEASRTDIDTARRRASRRRKA